jgi:hypothetical protein
MLQKIFIIIATLLFFPVTSLTLGIMLDSIFEARYFKEAGAIGYAFYFLLFRVLIGIFCCGLILFHKKIPFFRDKPVILIHFAFLFIMFISYYFYIRSDARYSFLYRQATKGNFGICRLFIAIGADMNASLHSKDTFELNKLYQCWE